MERDSGRRVPVGLLVTGTIVIAIAAFIGIGLSKGWFNNDDYGDKVHPRGAIFAYTVPKHFTKGSYGGGQHSNYRGPQEGPEYSYIALVNRQWDIIYVEVVHGQSEAAGRSLLRGIRAAAKAKARSEGGSASGFELTIFQTRPAVRWAVTTHSSSGYPLGQRRTWIRHGSDAAIVTCQWRTDDGQQARVEKGCDDFMKTFRFTS
jgi:hypothetical protein